MFQLFFCLWLVVASLIAWVLISRGNKMAKEAGDEEIGFVGSYQSLVGFGMVLGGYLAIFMILLGICSFLTHLGN